MPQRSRTDLLVLALLCIAAMAYAARGILDERQVSMDGDMPRYLMNGVFVADFARDLPLTAPLTYTREYFARYPALSLGHHPILPAVILAPFYLVFGVSVFAARLSVLGAYAVALMCLYGFARRQYGPATAALTLLLFSATPGVTVLYRVVLSEPYTLALVLAALYAMARHTATGRPVYAWAFAVTAVLSVWAKQLAVFMAPVYAYQYIEAYGVRALFRPKPIAAIAAMGLCLAPLAAITLEFSSFNANMAANANLDTPGRISTWNAMRFARRLWDGPFAVPIPLLVLGAAGVIRGVLARDRRLATPLLWIATVYAAVLALGIENDRFLVYWLPAFAILGATCVEMFREPRLRAMASAAVAATAIAIGVTGYRNEMSHPERVLVRPIQLDAYEEAARLVSTTPLGNSVLYSAGVDTGYFVFFVRKHDPRRQAIVLRADKILTTSRMGRLDWGERQVAGAAEIPALLQRYGVGHVVLEESRYPEGPLQWLMTSVGGPQFTRVARLPIDTTDRRLRGRSLSIYAFNDRQPGDREADLSLGVPLMNDRITLKLGDLLHAPSR